MTYELLSPLTFQVEVPLDDGLKVQTERVNECRTHRGYTGCSECPIYEECEMLKALLRARFGQGSVAG